MAKTAEQYEQERYYNSGKHQGSMDEQSRCEAIVRRAIDSGSTDLVGVLRSIESGEDPKAQPMAIAPDGSNVLERQPGETMVAHANRMIAHMKRNTAPTKNHRSDIGDAVADILCRATA